MTGPTDPVRLVAEYSPGEFRSVGDAFPLPVQVSDQATLAFDIHLLQGVAGPWALNSDTVPNNRVVEVVTPHTLVAGNRIFIADTFGGFEANVVSIVNQVGYDEITINFPVARVYAAGSALVGEVNHNMAVAGSAGSPVSFRLPIAGFTTIGSAIILDVTSVTVSIMSNTQMDDGLFGDLAALTNGVQLRVWQAGVITNLWNATRNHKFSILGGYGFRYTTAAPAGLYGMISEIRYGGQQNRGVVLRLNMDTDDYIELLVQDDISGLDHMCVTVRGHVATQVG